MIAGADRAAGGSSGAADPLRLKGGASPVPDLAGRVADGDVAAELVGVIGLVGAVVGGLGGGALGGGAGGGGGGGAEREVDVPRTVAVTGGVVAVVAGVVTVTDGTVAVVTGGVTGNVAVVTGVGAVTVGTTVVAGNVGTVTGTETVVTVATPVGSGVVIPGAAGRFATAAPETSPKPSRVTTAARRLTSSSLPERRLAEPQRSGVDFGRRHSATEQP